MKAVRDHDKFYLKEDRKNTPKEYFKFIVKHTDDVLSSASSMVDIGCATGDFLSYLSGLYPEAKLSGLDVMDELLEHARREVPGVTFENANIYTGEHLPKETYDVIFLNGVHSIFDDLKPWITNLLSLCSENGRVYVFGNFNPSDVDLLVKARYSTLDESKPWQLGFNLWSKKTMELYLDEIGADYRFYDFEIGIDLGKHPDDPFRSWTFKAAEDKRMIVNGTQILRNLSLLEIIPAKA